LPGSAARSHRFAGATESVRVSRHRFSTRGPKSQRGTTVSFRLTAPAKVLFIVRGPSPSCGVVGKKSVRGRRGPNSVRLDGRFDGHPLAPGTYEIVVVAKRGTVRRYVGRISIQVVAPGSRVRGSGSPPVFRCAVPVAQSGIPGATLFLSPPSKNRSRGLPIQEHHPAQQTPGRSGVLAEPPFHIWNGSGPLDAIIDVLVYSTLGIGGVVLIMYFVRFYRSSWH
jgi:hypothetical protein